MSNLNFGSTGHCLLSHCNRRTGQEPDGTLPGGRANLAGMRQSPCFVRDLVS